MLFYHLRSWYFIIIFNEFFEMKTIKLLIIFALFTAIAIAQQAAPAPLPTDEFYEHFVLPHTNAAAPEGYGLTPKAPIQVGIYEATLSDQDVINRQLGRFLKTYLWADGAPVIYLNRKTTMIDAVNYTLFRVTKAGGKDTLTIYTDMYKSGPVYAPKGFKFYTKENLAADIGPIIQDIKKYNAIADKYTDTTAKKLSFQMINYLQQNIGLDYLIDKDNLAVVLNDTGIDLDLRAYLIRAYMFHKVEYEGTGHAEPLKEAFNSMVDDYTEVIKRHEIFAKGSLPTTMVKK